MKKTAQDFDGWNEKKKQLENSKSRKLHLQKLNLRTLQTI